MLYNMIILQIFSVSESISHSPDWPQMHYIAKDDLELPIYAPPCPNYVVLRTEFSSLYNATN